MNQNNQVTITLKVSGHPKRAGEAISRLLAALPAAEQLEALEEVKALSRQISEDKPTIHSRNPIGIWKPQPNSPMHLPFSCVENSPALETSSTDWNASFTHSNRFMNMTEISQPITQVIGIHTLATEWLCTQLSEETGGTAIQWKVSAFTHAKDRFEAMNPEAFKAVTDENLTMAQQLFDEGE